MFWKIREHWKPSLCGILTVDQQIRRLDYRQQQGAVCMVDMSTILQSIAMPVKYNRTDMERPLSSHDIRLFFCFSYIFL